MSPAAMEFQSPITKQPSSFQNPNPNFTAFAPINLSQQNMNSSSSSSSSSFDNNNNNNDTNKFGVQTGSAVSGRVKPRLVKVRKSQQGRATRSGAAASEIGSGFNPFKQSGENSGQVNNDITTSSNLLNGSDFGDMGFVFGANKSEMKAEFEDKNLRFDNVCGSVFGANESNVEKRETGEFVVNSGGGNVGFVFGDNGNGLGLNLNLNLEKGDSSESEFNKVVGDSGLGFVFGASLFNSGSDLNLENRERFNENGSWKQHYGKGVFVFGSGSKKSSSSSECAAAKCTDEMKSESESLGNDDSIVKNQNGNLGFNVDDKYEVGINVASSSGTTPVFKLPDELKKLDINDFENVDGTDTTKDSNKDSCANAETIFVFRSSKESSGSSDGSSATTSHDQISEALAADVELNDRDNCNTGDKNHAEFGNSCNIATDFVRISSSEPFTFQAGIDQVNYDEQPSGVAAPSLFSSVGLDSKPNGNVSEKPSMVGVEQKDENSSASTPNGLGVPFMDFKAPNWDPSCFKANLFPELNKKLEFSVKSRTIKDKRSKKIRGKVKQPSLHKQCPEQDHVPKESNCEENPNSPMCCSPMDFSPYQETIEADQFSRETSVASIESSLLDSNCVPSASHLTVTTEPKNEDLATEGGYDVNGCDPKHGKPNGDSNGYDHDRCCIGDCPSTGFVSGAETACPGLKPEPVCSSSGSGVAFAEDGAGSHTKKQESNCRIQFCFDLGLENEKKFTFSASSSAQDSSSLTKRQQRRKNRIKVGNDTFIISPSLNVKAGSSSVQSSPCASTSSLFNLAQGQGDISTSQSERGNKSTAGEQVKQGSVSSAATFQAACEMGRLRGNQAYKNGNLSKAEDYYTQGINSAPSSDTSGCWVKPVVLCYSNRAATRISLGRIREALGDCIMAAALDPNFLKVYVRAANCHLLLGEVEKAVQYFNKCLESGAVVCLDRRITIEAADGLQKAQKVAECINDSAKLLEQKTSDAANSALEIIAEALSTSSHSEKLLQMKAEALCVLRKYEEVIQLCEQTLHFAETNCASASTNNQLSNMDGSGCESYLIARLWRWRLMSKSYFYMGRIELALDLLQKLEQVGSIQDKYAHEILESSKSLAMTIRWLLQHKNAGNAAIQSGSYTEAVEHYTVALSSNVESRPFAAICFCNRAAAHQALGQITDAIADCSLAMALDGNYTKAVSRRAALHEMIRDYGQAASDLQRLISILENQSDVSGTPGRSTGSTKELRQAQRHLSSMQEEAKKGIPLDLYLILGIRPSDSASEIKKAYRKAALRHHPDKAGQFLARSESGDEGRLWKEISQEVHKDADRLFKMIGEAYAVLSDTTKQSEYDLEEELRKAPKESNGRNPYGRPSDVHSYPFERSTSRRSWQENWRTYGNSYSRW